MERPNNLLESNSSFGTKPSNMKKILLLASSSDIDESSNQHSDKSSAKHLIMSEEKDFFRNKGYSMKRIENIHSSSFQDVDPEITGEEEKE